MRKYLLLPVITVALLSALVSVSARADQYAYVRNISGNAYVQGDDQNGQPQPLSMNMPIMQDDSIWTDNSGRMAVMLQDGNYVWVDYSTRLEVDQLPEEAPDAGVSLRLKLWKGTVLLDLRNWRPSMASYVVSTPSSSLSPSEGGLYLVEVESVDRSRLICLGGSCMVSSAGSSVELRARQMTYADYGYPPLAPMAESLSYSSILNYRDANRPKYDGGVSEHYLPTSLSAYSADFDNYGRWVSTDEYGYIWCPSGIAPNWNPYEFGRWWWGPWGMTWIPAEAWGWVPFHYGRWTFIVGLGWGWIPMPAFAPAWVSFYWGAGGWFGWCPLGYYGLPYWRHCGWYSVPVGYIYHHGLGGYLNHHRRAPPPHPIYPRARGGSAHLRKNGPPRHGGTGMHVSPINLPPGRVRAYRDGRVGLRDLGAHLEDPVHVRVGRNFPSVDPSRGRSWRNEPGRIGSRERPSGGVSPRSRPGSGGTRVEPRRLPPVRDRSGGDSGNRMRPGGSHPAPGSGGRYNRRPPRQERPPVTWSPKSGARQAPRQWDKGTRSPGRVERARPSIPKVAPRTPRVRSRPKVSERPRYIPSRPSTGVTPRRSGGGGGRKHR